MAVTAMTVTAMAGAPATVAPPGVAPAAVVRWPPRPRDPPEAGAAARAPRSLPRQHQPHRPTAARHPAPPRSAAPKRGRRPDCSMHLPPSPLPADHCCCHRLRPAIGSPEVEQRRDPWAPFRIWVALTIGLFALRAVSLSTPFTWLGAIPGWVLLILVMISLILASLALLFPARVVPWREGEPGLWAEISDDWRHWRHRLQGSSARGRGAQGPRAQGPTPKSPRAQGQGAGPAAR